MQSGVKTAILILPCDVAVAMGRAAQGKRMAAHFTVRRAMYRRLMSSTNRFCMGEMATSSHTIGGLKGDEKLGGISIYALYRLQSVCPV